MAKLDAHEVQAWLAMMEPEAVCGEAGEPESCPLATYLKGTYNTQEVCVRDEDFLVHGVEYELPDWAASFVDRVDRRSFRHQVTARCALEILDLALSYPHGEDLGEEQGYTQEEDEEEGDDDDADA